MSRGDDKVANWQANARAARAAKADALAKANQREKGEQRSSWLTGSGGRAGAGAHRGGNSADGKDPRRGNHRIAGVRYSMWNGKPIAPKRTVWGKVPKADRPVIPKGGKVSAWNGKVVAAKGFKVSGWNGKIVPVDKGKGGKGGGKK